MNKIEYKEITKQSSCNVNQTIICHIKKCKFNLDEKCKKIKIEIIENYDFQPECSDYSII